MHNHVESEILRKVCVMARILDIYLGESRRQPVDMFMNNANETPSDFDGRPFANELIIYQEQSVKNLV